MVTKTGRSIYLIRQMKLAKHRRQSGAFTFTHTHTQGGTPMTLSIDGGGIEGEETHSHEPVVG